MAGLTLEDFRSNLTNVVRPNRFLVTVYPPSILSGMDTEAMQYMAQSASIPDRSFGEIELKYYGMSYKIPAGEILQDLIITFINDEDWQVRSLFESWSQLINNRDSSKKAYARELFEGAWIIVEQLDFSGNTIATYNFANPFPKTVDQIDLNQETMDSFETFQVTFTYSYWFR